MSGQAYRGPTRGAAGCGTDLVAALVAMAIIAVALVALGMHLEWW